MRLYQSFWTSLKEVYPDRLMIELHPAFFERTLKAIRKEAYADTRYKSLLKSRGKKPVLRYTFHSECSPAKATFWIEKLLA
jgi:hypothetical protein